MTYDTSSDEEAGEEEEKEERELAEEKKDDGEEGEVNPVVFIGLACIYAGISVCMAACLTWVVRRQCSSHIAGHAGGRKRERKRRGKGERARRVRVRYFKRLFKQEQ